MTTRLMDTLDRDAAVMRTMLAKLTPATDIEAQESRELLIFLHAALHVIRRDEGSTADELREFAGEVLDRVPSPSSSA